MRIIRETWIAAETTLGKSTEFSHTRSRPMAKQRKKKQKPSAINAAINATREDKPTSNSNDQNEDTSKWAREAVESIVIAVLLALLFRGFEAEAFIIPTGSMAPTLQGQHKDVRCPQCQFAYRAGATQESIVGTTCPMCRFELNVDPANPNHGAFSGDRILVNKFIYQFTEPERWDVIVFKYPGNAKQNYIKRLVGLPGESLQICSGDVYVRPPGETEYVIARKSVDKMRHMLHLVHDTRYIPEMLTAVDWPSRWFDPDGGWSISQDRRNYSLSARNGEVHWLRYRHVSASANDWRRSILKGKSPRLAPKPRLIADDYAYNNHRILGLNRTDHRQLAQSGMHWVGDLAVETTVQITNPGGHLWMELIEGGNKLTCRIDVQTGVAELQINGGQKTFDRMDGEDSVSTLTAQTAIRGAGKYRVMWANVDNRVTLWVNRRPVSLTASGKTHPGDFSFPRLLTPSYSESDPGDLQPIRIGGEGIEMTASDLKVYRDIYYVASVPGRNYDYRRMGVTMDEVQSEFAQPDDWNSSNLFKSRDTELTFHLEADQFFPMGDNSPQSKDARLWHREMFRFGWGDPVSHVDAEGRSIQPGGSNQLSHIKVNNYVDRRLLIGKAFLVYWPHGWNPGKVKLPLIPNLDRMGRIR